jgi:ribonuclease HI
MLNLKNVGHKLLKHKSYLAKRFSSDKLLFNHDDAMNKMIFKKTDELPNLNSFRRSYKVILNVVEESIYPALVRYAEKVESGEKPFTGKKIINFKQPKDDIINCQVLNILNFDLQKEMLKELAKVLKSPNGEPGNMNIFVDGGCSGLLKTGSFGVSVFSNQERKVCVMGNIGNDNTSNVAEYFSLTIILFILSQINDLNINTLKIYADSQLMVRQINKEYQIKSNHIFILYKVLTNILKKIQKNDFKIIHVIREFNNEADYLSNLGKTYSNNSFKVYF